MSKKKRSRSRRPNKRLENTQGVPKKNKAAPKKSSQPDVARNRPYMPERKVRGPPKGQKQNPRKDIHQKATNVYKRSSQEKAPFPDPKGNTSAIIHPDSESPKGGLSPFDSQTNLEQFDGSVRPVIVHHHPHIEISPTVVIVEKSESVADSRAKSRAELWQRIFLLIALVTAIVTLIAALIQMRTAFHIDASTPTQSATPLATWTVDLSPTSIPTGTSWSSPTATFIASPIDTITSPETGTPTEISTSIPTIPPTSPPLRVGQLKICIVAGSGVLPGQLFTINVDGSSYSVPAGTADGDSCIFAEEFPVNAQVTVQEVISTDFIVTLIDVKPERRVVSKNVSLGIVVVKIRQGEIEIIFTNELNVLPTIAPTATYPSTGTASPTLTPTATGTLFPPTTSTSDPTIIPTIPITPVPSVTPTQPPTLTPTSAPIDHNLIVNSERSCKGWEVSVIVNPTNAEVSSIPAQSGKWKNEKEVTVIITARWPDGVVKTAEIKIKKPDCDD